MATIKLEGNEIHSVGELPAIGSDAPAFTLTNNEMAETSLADYAGKKVILNIFVAIDTGICAESTRRFNTQPAHWITPLYYASQLTCHRHWHVSVAQKT